jgi:membrane-bound serine protease (ClpP class)
MLASLLLSVAMLGILIELRTPGFGLPGALGVTSLALLLGGHWIVQLVGWEELLLTWVGVVLMALEIFVIPGFGVAGIAGVRRAGGRTGDGTRGARGHADGAGDALGRIGLSIAGALGVSIVLWRVLPQSVLGRGSRSTPSCAPRMASTSAPIDAAWLGG